MNKHTHNEKMVKAFSVGLLIIYVILLIPVLYIGRYNYHCADDFGFSALSHNVWKETGSLIEVCRAAKNTVVDRWHTWQGTVVTMFLMALEPGLFGDKYYHFVSWIMIGAMSISALYLFKVLLVKYIGSSKSVWISVSMLYLIFALECIPDPLQGFFWYNGAVHYIIPHSMAMLLVAFLINAGISNRNKRLYYCACACVMAALLGGCNYISALGTGVGLTFAIIASCFLKKRKSIWIYILPTLAFLPIFLLNVLAPGNKVRQANFDTQLGFFKTVMLAFCYCIEKCFSDWLDWKVLILLLMLMPFSLLIVKNVKEKFTFDFKFPLLVFAVSYCFLSSLFAPTLYGLGSTGGGRTENIIFLDYVLLLVFNMMYLIGWIDSKIEFIDKINSEDGGTVSSKVFYGFVIVATLFAAGLTSIHDANSFTSTAAIESVISGEAARYGEETKARTELINNCAGEVLELPRFVEAPYLLYMDDIVPDYDDWRNNSMERYYGIEKVIGFSKDN